ncbi:MAG: histidinol-phosphatase [Lentisphaeria bacterium]|nr:histidinol-phosphatase [Lentisphaeria bacterium]
MDELKKYLTAYPGPGPEFSLHNHSNWSDGSASPEEMCRAAKAAGVRFFGLSDHYVDHPAPPYPVYWSMDLTRLDDYAAELARLKKEFNDDGFTVLAGLEVDFFFENIDAVLAKLDCHPWDFLIGSVHYIGSFPIDHSAENWAALSPEENKSICHRYWETLEAAAASGKFTFLGHLDLPKKFGYFHTGPEYMPEICRVLDAAAANGTPIELNTAGWFKPCAEPYPSLEILREANRRKIPVIVTPDAHAPEHITRSFPEARELLRQAGYPV